MSNITGIKFSFSIDGSNYIFNTSGFCEVYSTKPGYIEITKASEQYSIGLQFNVPTPDGTSYAIASAYFNPGVTRSELSMVEFPSFITDKSIITCSTNIYENNRVIEMDDASGSHYITNVIGTEFITENSLNSFIKIGSNWLKSEQIYLKDISDWKSIVNFQKFNL